MSRCTSPPHPLPTFPLTGGLSVIAFFLSFFQLFALSVIFSVIEQECSSSGGGGGESSANFALLSSHSPLHLVVLDSFSIRERERAGEKLRRA